MFDFIHVFFLLVGVNLLFFFYKSATKVSCIHLVGSSKVNFTNLYFLIFLSISIIKIDQVNETNDLDFIDLHIYNFFVWRRRGLLYVYNITKNSLPILPGTCQ